MQVSPRYPSLLETLQFVKPASVQSGCLPTISYRLVERWTPELARLAGQIEFLNGKRPKNLRSNRSSSVLRYITPIRAFKNGARQDELLSEL